MYNKLTNDNFLIHAMHHYDNSQCSSIKEFEEDIKRFLYIKKLLLRYKAGGEIKERLVLNHLIVLYNLWGMETTNMLFFKIDKDLWDTLITFLVYLNRMPDEVIQHGIKLIDIPLDECIIKLLRDF